MMRLLSDKTGRVYQRVGREGETLKQEPQEEALSLPVAQGPVPEHPQYGWSSVRMTQGQYGTRSKTQRNQNHFKTNGESLNNEEILLLSEGLLNEQNLSNAKQSKFSYVSRTWLGCINMQWPQNIFLHFSHAKKNYESECNNKNALY